MQHLPQVLLPQRPAWCLARLTVQEAASAVLSACYPTSVQEFAMQAPKSRPLCSRSPRREPQDTLAVWNTYWTPHSQHTRSPHGLQCRALLPHLCLVLLVLQTNTRNPTPTDPPPGPGYSAPQVWQWLGLARPAGLEVWEPTQPRLRVSIPLHLPSEQGVQRPRLRCAPLRAIEILQHQRKLLGGPCLFWVAPLRCPPRTCTWPWIARL
mmetsp:Transcript_95110/g.254169  ORF Transcript_95110/g.254169 Transcript_95110/m.254169 type:complete len:209 (-) Transcript_95110:160-786(-)